MWKGFFNLMNSIWFFMIFIAIIYGILTGNVEGINNAILKEATEGTTFAIGLVGIMSFWLGIMKIAEDSGLLKKISNTFRPIIRLLFPQLPKNHKGEKYILMNFISNMFGLGNASTAFGIQAIKELQTLNKGSKVASNTMIMFLLINMSSLQLVPLSIIKIRGDYNSVNPSGIISITIISSFVSTSLAIIIGKYYEGRSL